MPVHCTEHQDWGWMAPAASITPDCSMAFWMWWERDKADCERQGVVCKYENKCWLLFAKLQQFALYASNLDATAISEKWQAHHHHQLRFL